MKLTVPSSALGLAGVRDCKRMSQPWGRSPRRGRATEFRNILTFNAVLTNTVTGRSGHDRNSAELGTAPTQSVPSALGSDSGRYLASKS